MSHERTTIVIPCYNEARRLDLDAFSTFVASDPDLELLFVDDGSQDETAELLKSLRTRLPSRIRILTLQKNSGKAEAVRRGLVGALDSGADIVGYLDADLATPVDEMARLLDVMRSGAAHVLLGSRVALLGREIQRTAARHYLGRVFASVASLVLRVPVYDTQCGAKIFRRTPAFEAALQQPFLTRWLFDVELLGRILVPDSGIQPLAPGAIREEPLVVWRDIKGSKLRPWHFFIAVIDLGRIAGNLERRRRRIARNPKR